MGDVREITYRLFFRGPLLWMCRTTYADGRIGETFMLAPRGWRR